MERIVRADINVSFKAAVEMDQVEMAALFPVSFYFDDVAWRTIKLSLWKRAL